MTHYKKACDLEIGDSLVITDNKFMVSYLVENIEIDNEGVTISLPNGMVFKVEHDDLMVEFNKNAKIYFSREYYHHIIKLKATNDSIYGNIINRIKNK